MKPGLVIAAACAALLYAAPAWAGDVDTIVARVTRAAGGLAAAQAIPALAYDLHIKEAGYEADATYLVDRNGRMRIDIYVGGKRVYTECYDGARAWQMDGAGRVGDESAQAAATLWHGTQYPGQILALAELPRHGHKIGFAGRERIDGIDYIVLELTMRDGFQTYRYVNPRTWRIEHSRDLRAPHPDIDPHKTLLDTAASDFRRVDGVVRAFTETQIDLASGKWNQTETVKAIRRLPRLADALFVRGSPPAPAP